MQASSLNLKIALVDESIAVNSDVSGFQAALQLLKNSNERYDYYWFAHTKGGSKEEEFFRTPVAVGLERSFWSQRAYIEANCDVQQYGVFAPYFVPATHPHGEITDFLRKITGYKYNPIGIVTMFTFFGLTSTVLNDFIDRVHPDFFQKNIVSDIGLSRYFFEGGFSWISDMYGLEPFFMYRENAKRQIPDMSLVHAELFDDNNLKSQKLTAEWRKDRSEYIYRGWPTAAGGQVHYDGGSHELTDFIEKYPQWPVHLDEIGRILGRDQSSLCHNILVEYENQLSHLREYECDVVHIGARSGISTAIWPMFFKNANVVTIDDTGAREVFSEKLTVEVGDQGDAEFLRRVCEPKNPLIVIDDGSHQSKKKVISLQTLLPIMKDGGMYFIEDLHTCTDRLRPHFSDSDGRTILDYIFNLLKYHSAENDQDLVGADDFEKFFHGHVERVVFSPKLLMIKLR